MANDSAKLRRQLERCTRELEQTLAMLAQLRRRRAPTPGKPPVAFEASEEGRVHANYRIEGTPEQLATFDFFLRHVSTACQFGATAFYQLMVDGDGAGSLVIEREGERVGVTAEEDAWLFGSGERPQGMVDVVVRDEEVLELEVV